MQRFKKILYVYDEESRVAGETLKLALGLAKTSGGTVDLLQVLTPPPVTVASTTLTVLRSNWLSEAEETFAAFARATVPKDTPETTILVGRPHIEIIREVLREGYDLVIKPIGSSGFIDRLLGRLDMRLLRHCPCPVWLSQGGDYLDFDNILAAVDAQNMKYERSTAKEQEAADILNRQILELSFSLCAQSNAVLHVGHVWHPPFMSMNSHGRAYIGKKEINAYMDTIKREHTNWLKRLMRRAKKWAGQDVACRVRLRTHLRRGLAGEEIPKLISDLRSDLVVMGTVARTGVSGLVIGNTAEEILDRVSCSVLAVKPDGFVSSVTLDD